MSKLSTKPTSKRMPANPHGYWRFALSNPYIYILLNLLLDSSECVYEGEQILVSQANPRFRSYSSVYSAAIPRYVWVSTPQSVVSCGFPAIDLGVGFPDTSDSLTAYEGEQQTYYLQGRTMQPTFPEKNTFSWEEKPRWAVWLIIEMFRKNSREGKNLARRKAYEACIEALKQAEHDHGIETVSTPKLKQLLIAAAQEHEWYQIDRKKYKQAPDPFTPPGFKFCRKCRETKPKDDFLTPVPPTKAKVYGWNEDTNQKYMGHLCTPCRHAYARKKSKARYKILHRFSDLQLRTTPGLATRVKQYQHLHAHIAAHSTRVRAAFSGVKVSLDTPDGTYYEYQFKTDELRQFYESKRVYLNAARNRLEAMMGEAAPLPDTWGMLLTRDEQAELADLHDRACTSSMAPNKPALWTLKIKEDEDE